MLIFCRNVIVGSCYCFFGSEYGNTPFFQSVKCLGTCNFVNIMTVDIQNIRAISYRTNHMSVPDFVKKCFCFQVLVFLFYFLLFTPQPPQGGGLILYKCMY